MNEQTYHTYICPDCKETVQWGLDDYAERGEPDTCPKCKKENALKLVSKLPLKCPACGSTDITVIDTDIIEYDYYEWSPETKRYSLKNHRSECGYNSETTIECSDCVRELTNEEYEAIWNEIN